MEQNVVVSRRSLWHPALPYALDYLGLVLGTAYLSMLWFMKRLDSLLLAIPLGVAFTVLASMVYYRWQHGRWLRRKSQLECSALQLWLVDELLAGSAEDLCELACDLLTTQEGYLLTGTGKRPLLEKDGHTFRLIVLRRHPSCPVDAQLLMQLDFSGSGIRGIAASTADFTDAARDYAQKADMHLLAPPDLASIAQRAGMQPPPKHRERYMRRACKERQDSRRHLLKRAGQIRSLRYLSGAMLLGLMGILSPWRGWYWLTALYCAVMGAAQYLSTRGKRADRS